MPKKLAITGILIILAIAGYFVNRAIATSNPHSWTNGLVGYWPFDGQYTTSTNGTRDVSNNGNWGVFNGGVKPVGGISGQALSFDGADDYINAGTAASLTSDLNAFSVEAWVKYDGSGNFAPIIGFSTNYYHGLFLKYTGGSTHPMIILNSSNYKYFYEGSLWDGAWHHVVFVVTGNSQADISDSKFYVDGISMASPGGSAGNAPQAKSYVNIGRASGSNYYLKSFLDEVRIYNRVLSAEEIKQHYDQTKRNIAINQPSGMPPARWWKMDEATGQIVRDYSVNAHNGTVNRGTDGATSTDGKVGKAVSFDGVDDSVSLGNDLQFHWTDSFSFSFWLKSSDAGDYNAILSKVTGHTNYGVWFHQGYVEFFSGSWQYATRLWARGLSNAADGQWHHFVVTYDGSQTAAGTNFYMDGVDDGRYIIDDDIDTDFYSSADVYLGYNPSFGGGTYWQGVLDDVRVYTYVRTAAQAASDYQAGAYRTIIATSNPNQWTNALVGYWNFDGPNTTSTSGTRDTSGQNNWGTFNGGVRPAGGLVGQALSFDGIDDYVSASSTSLDMTNNLTIELWVKLASVQASAQYADPISHGHTGTNGWVFQFDHINRTNGACVLMSNNGTTLYALCYSDLFDDRWHQLVAVKSSDPAIGMEIYKDGVRVSNNITFTNDMVLTGGNVSIGRDTGTGTARCTKGLIDEVRIYNRALSAGEIAQHYQQTRRNLGI